MLFEEFGWGTAFGWAAAIENNLSEGETAMDAFFRLLDQYRAVVAAQRIVAGSGKCGRT
ncbi:hypothetical protein [Nocardia sp. NPDC050413]|uniref:hypothetical protein n=1 Tax=Nocardia sp. NPDC050413 TaxID=3155784 RepID=UPI0033CC794A